MSLFEPALFVHLEPAEADILSKPIEGDGGHQRLLRELLHGWDPIEHPIVVLEPGDLRKAAAYAYDYGSGGYQVRFRTLVSAARRQGWTE